MKNNAARKLKQVPADFLIIGVDPHKKTHVAAHQAGGETPR